MNLASIPLSHASSRPDHPAIEENGDILTHAQSARRIGAYAATLAHHSIARGDRVGLCLRDTGDHLLLHYAIAWLGATIVPIDHRWTDGEKILEPSRNSSTIPPIATSFSM